jgi:hypothetical protein
MGILKLSPPAPHLADTIKFLQNLVCYDQEECILPFTLKLHCWFVITVCQ